MNKKVNILFIAHDNDLSGACLSLLTLLSKLNKDIFSPHVIVPWHGELKNEIEKLGIPVYVKAINHWIPFQTEWGAKNLKDLILNLKSRIWAISHIIQNNKIDIVYTNTVTVLEGALAALITKRPHVWHAREFISNNADLKSYIPFFFTRLIINKLSYQIIVNSNSLNKSLHLTLYPNKIHTIYNAIDINSYFKKNQNIQLKQQLNINETTKIVSCIGTLSPRKDIITFINAAKIIIDNNHDVVFLLIGNGNEEYITKLKALIQELNLLKIVRFLGARGDIPDLLNITDILIHSSSQEAFGRVIIEAMAANKPVIATKSGGPEEIIIDGETGFLVPVKNPQSIAEKTCYLLDHPEHAKIMGENGFMRAQQMFSMEQYVYNIERVISKTIEQTKI